jgi:hypothetical protein
VSVPDYLQNRNCHQGLSKPLTDGTLEEPEDVGQNPTNRPRAGLSVSTQPGLREKQECQTKFDIALNKLKLQKKKEYCVL